MPISVCRTEDQVKKWCDELVKEGKYFVYYTEESEVILEPAKSTRPLRYCYAKLPSNESAKKLAEELGKTYNLPVISVVRICWDTEKGPAIRIPVEE